MPRGRVRIANGTVVSDCGSLLRGGAVKVYAQGKQTGKTAYSTDPAYYLQMRQARLNAVRVIYLDPWKQSQGHSYWDLAHAPDRSALLSELDRVVELASAHDLYALIDYHDIGNYNLAQLETFWEMVAPRYADLSHVFYELANEPVSWTPEAYSDQALREQEQVYRRIRQLAPHTHVVLLSFANTAYTLVPQGNPMLDVVERMSGIDWSNASVSFHPYKTLSSQIILSLRERVPVLSTELDLPTHARSSDEPHIYVCLDGAEYAQQTLERIGVSWFGWEIDGPRKLDKYFRRGVLMDASIKGYLWKPDWPLRKSLADYSSIVRFFREYPATEAMRQMGLAKWQQLAGLAWLACGAALMEAIMLWALLPLSEGIVRGNFQFFWRSSALALLRAYLPPAAQTNTATLLVFAAGLFLAGLIRSWILYVLNVSAGRYYGVYSASLADFSFRRYLAFGKAYYEQRGSEPQELINSNQQFLNLLNRLLRVILKTPLLIVYFAFMAILWWPALLIVLLPLPTLYVFERWTASAHGNAPVHVLANRRVATNVLRMLRALPLIHTFSSYEQVVQDHAAVLEEARKSDFAAWRLDSIHACVRNVTMLLAVLLLFSLAAMGEGQPPILKILLSVFIACLALRQVSAFLETEREFARKLPALRQFFDLFNDNGKYILPPGTRAFQGIAESIRFRRLTFAYPDREPVLRDVSFLMRKGEMTALIGPAGSGKSTLAALLLRYYDVPPQTIWLDRANIRQFTPSSLRENIAWISPDLPLLDDTLRNNLIAGLPATISDVDLARAIREACLDDLVASLPSGLDTKIGAGGTPLSGGQQQRVALARTLLKRAPIVIVDGADSLDCETEPGRETPLERLTRDCTSLVITGRMSTIKRAHTVVLLEKGRVIETGAPRELLLRRGHFFQMWAAKQFD